MRYTRFRWVLSLLTFPFLFLVAGAAAQLEFVTTIESIEVPGGDNVTLMVRLTPSVTVPVRATASTEVEDRTGRAVGPAGLAPGDRVRIEGLFTSAGLLAQQIEITDTADEFELKGELTDVDPLGRTVTLLGFEIAVAPIAEVEDAAGLPLNLSELQPGQTVRVEGRTTPDGFEATEIRVAPPAQFAEIRFQGLVREASASHLRVELPGGDPVLVEIHAGTERRGSVAVGSLVEVEGRLTERLSVNASRVESLRPFRLLPDEIRLDFNQTGRVDLVARAAASTDLMFALTSANPSVATPDAASVVLPEGALTVSFQVLSGAVEGRTEILVGAPAEAGGGTLRLEVEVESEAPDDPDNELAEIRFSPDKIEDGPAGMREVRLVLNRPLPSDVTAPLSLKEGRSGDVLFPATVTISAGDASAPVILDIQPDAGRTKIRAVLPPELGGDTATVNIELPQQARVRRDLRWVPDDLELTPGGSGIVELRLDAPAPFDFEAVITVKDGDPSILETAPSRVTFPAGAQAVMLSIRSTGAEGRVRFQAALPVELGGDDDTLKVEVER